jgi:hypothetical protein
MNNSANSENGFEFAVRLWGMDSEGHAFFQNATAGKIKGNTAQLSGVAHPLQPGDVIGVQSGQKKARCRIVWVVDAGPVRKTEAGIELLEGQQIPWPDPPAEKIVVEPTSESKGRDNRKFVRHKIFFPVEIGFEDESRARMQTNATDIGGRGCYVETMMPLAIGTAVQVMFWMNDEKIRASGIVRTCDPHMGMGIEFISLDDTIQQKLQQFIETLDTEAADSNPTGAEAAEAAAASGNSESTSANSKSAEDKA